MHSTVPFGAASVGVITAGTITDDTTAIAGTIEHVSMYCKNGTTKVAEFTCGVSATEFIISSLTVNNNDTIGVTSFTITVPA